MFPPQIISTQSKSLGAGLKTQGKNEEASSPEALSAPTDTDNSTQPPPCLQSRAVDRWLTAGSNRASDLPTPQNAAHRREQLRRRQR
mmetsp:Transcript_3635/g.9459  ORF Transcript_3635/g.9459 Transcript_3635/m.9459 type:complete len:87 (+) Transcript_3635:91-351(+)